MYVHQQLICCRRRPINIISVDGLTIGSLYSYTLACLAFNLSLLYNILAYIFLHIYYIHRYSYIYVCTYTVYNTHV